MANEYFNPGSAPANSAPGSSAVMRAQFASISAAFDKLPVMAGSADEFVIVNPTGTGMIASGFSAVDIVSLNGIQTITNKTINWNANNISTIPLAGGGTGATTLAGAQAALGITLKADANNAVLTGAPTAPTPPAGNNSPRIATTAFVQEAVVIAGGATPSNVTPVMNGVAAAGVGNQVSRDDHVHPTDTSRASTAAVAAAATAAGTSFTPTGAVLATDVQAAIAELDSDLTIMANAKANLASPIFTGNPTAPTPLTSDNDTSIATTAFVQAVIAQQPAGMSPSNMTPLMDGTAAPGTSVDGARSDHVHPTDTSRAAASAATAAGTSFTPVGTVAATDVQAAIAEVASEAAQKSSNLSDLANAATARTNLGIPASVQNAEYLSLSTVAGANTITATATPAPAAYAANQTFRFVSAAANTGAVTLNINGLGAVNLLKQSSSGPVALVANDIPAAGVVVQVTHDGTQFQATSGVVSSSTLPTQTGNSGKLLTTNGTVASWSASLPRFQVGDSGTATHNFTLTPEADDGTMKLARGNAGATTQDILTVDADGRVAHGLAMGMVRLNTANGHGSTNTKIRRFSTVVTNQGADITYADSATLGASFTVAKAGVYSISYTDCFTANIDAGLGISLNSNQLTTNVGAITVSNILALSGDNGQWSANVQWTGYLAVNDVIRPHTAGGATGTFPQLFTMARVA